MELSFLSFLLMRMQLAKLWQIREVDVIYSDILVAVFLIRIHLIRSRIQHFRLKTDRDPQIEQNLQLNKKFGWDQKLQFTYPWASIMDVPKIQKKPSTLKREHPALQNIKFLFFFLFFGSFLPSRIHRPDRIRVRNTACGQIQLGRTFNTSETCH
jgi:hypothetical protein